MRLRHDEVYFNKDEQQAFELPANLPSDKCLEPALDAAGMARSIRWNLAKERVEQSGYKGFDSPEKAISYYAEHSDNDIARRIHAFGGRLGKLIAPYFGDKIETDLRQLTKSNNREKE